MFQVKIWMKCTISLLIRNALLIKSRALNLASKIFQLTSRKPLSQIVCED